MTKKEFSPPSSLQVARSVGWVTFLEIIRDKILYNIVLCAIVILGIGMLASRISFIRPERIMTDFGLSAINLSCCMIAIFTGAAMLGKEFERRTIFVALSHPITRFQFTLGKFAGLSAVLVCNWVLLCITYVACLLLMGSEAGQVLTFLNKTVAMGLFLVLIESIMLASLAIFFSTFSTTSLSAVFGIGAYLIGNNISQLRFIIKKMENLTLAGALDFLITFLPNLEYFNLGTKVTYGLPVPWSFAVTALVYGIVVIAVALFLSGIFVRNKEV